MADYYLITLANGTVIGDPQPTGDYTNVDFAFKMGLVSDRVFAGRFFIDPVSGLANGYWSTRSAYARSICRISPSFAPSFAAKWAKCKLITTKCAPTSRWKKRWGFI